MKVLICDNDRWPVGDTRKLWAFQELVDKGDIESFHLIAHGSGNPDHRKIFFQKLAIEMEQYRPDLVMWTKDSESDLSDSEAESLSRKTILILYNADPWHWFMKPVPHNMKVVAKHARRVFVVGMGEIADQFPMAGDRIRYSSHGYCDPDILPEPVKRAQKMVFIGNSNRRLGKVLGRFGIEHQKGRQKAIGTLKRRLAARFEAYGSGYPKSWGIQRCGFDEQFSLINESLASFAIDASAGAANYFSNRTPFCLASGSIHLIIRRPGFDQTFLGCDALMQVANADEAADAFEAIYSWNDERKWLMSQQAKEFAAKNFRMPDLFRKVLQESTL